MLTCVSIYPFLYPASIVPSRPCVAGPPAIRLVRSACAKA